MDVTARKALFEKAQAHTRNAVRLVQTAAHDDPTTLAQAASELRRGEAALKKLISEPVTRTTASED